MAESHDGKNTKLAVNGVNGWRDDRFQSHSSSGAAAFRNVGHVSINEEHTVCVVPQWALQLRPAVKKRLFPS